MTGNRFIPLLLGVIFAALLVLALPATASAQTSTFSIPFSRTGTPGTVLVPVLDPITGFQLTDPTTGQPVYEVQQTGAFVDPCTKENVDVIGSTTLTITVSVNGSGQMKVSVGETTKGAGRGQTSGTIYSFSDSQQFSTQYSVGSDPTSITAVTFGDKLFLRGAKSTDNWTIRTAFKIQINASGAVTSTKETLTGDVCKG
jgi:hypothetical protein